MQETIEKPIPTCWSTGGWRSQCGHRRGWRGWVVGQLMAMKNKKRSLWVLSLLNLQSTDRVLEIGFGPGGVGRAGDFHA